MSDINTTTDKPELPEWLPSELDTTPEREPNRALAILIAVSVVTALFIAALSTVLIIQGNNLEDTRADLASTASDLTEAESDLAASEADLKESDADLTATLDDLAAANTRLDACAQVVKMSDHQYEAMLLLADGASDIGSSSAVTKIDKATEHVEDINNLIERAGFESYEEFWTACAPAYETI